MNRATRLLFAIATALPALAQDRVEPARPTFDQAAASIQRQLADSLGELARLREEIAADKIPRSRRLAELEAELSQARQEHQQQSRLLDAGALDLANLRSTNEAREQEAAYLGSLLGEYGRNFESRLHVAELDRHAETIAAARLAAENSALARHDVLAAQLALVEAALERLHDGGGGARFAGTAVDTDGTVREGSFAVLGPAAVFRSTDGRSAGTVEQRLGSLQPAVAPFPDPLHAAAAGELIATAAGLLPFDPTLGDARKVEATRESLWQHVQAGGPVMVPIFALAAAALLVALIKWVALLAVRRPASQAVRVLLQAIGRGDRVAATRAAAALPGPSGRMLAEGVAHLDEPRELIEEVMYEAVLGTRLRLQRWLPFIAITASSAPLLGLLGTVTGIMNTFSLMTVFGTGDVKTLSSGIAEALITTEFGLYVAIPSLLLHAFLARRVKGVIDDMERSAIALVNQVARSGIGSAAALAPADALPAAPSPEDVRAALAGLLAPVLRPDGEVVRSS